MATTPNYLQFGSTKKEKAAAAAKAARAARRTKRKKKELVIKGSVQERPIYSVVVDISGDCLSFASPLTDAKADRYYWIRASITQHVGQPGIQGFKLEWSKPTNWTWVDNAGTYSFEETISNPLTVIRKVRSPKLLEKVAFSAKVTDWYL